MLQNGIVLPDEWPPRMADVPADPQTPPYLVSLESDIAKEVYMKTAYSIDDYLDVIRHGVRSKFEEGRIHFAGEHASLHHFWIQGAIESGLREAIAIHRAP